MNKRRIAFLLSIWLTGFLAAILATDAPVSTSAQQLLPAVTRESLHKSPPADALLPATRLASVHLAGHHPFPNSAGKVFSYVAPTIWRCLSLLDGGSAPRTSPVFLAYFRHLFRHGISINAP